MNINKSNNCLLLFPQPTQYIFDWWWPDRMKFLIILLLILSVKLPCANGEHLLYKLKGTVGGKNLTYHHMKWSGRIRVLLVSLAGDTDLYVSDKTTKPNPDNFELYSATCGQESVDIPARFKRPVSIGVFGYPLMEKSHYELTFIHLTDNDEPDEYERMAAKERYVPPEYEPEDFNPNPSRSEDSQPKTQKIRDTQHDNDGYERWEKEEEDVESFIWALFIYVLKFIFDILL
ncbi:Hypothetical predicted protein [Octopus vulgaris]|uniref:Uncharacterized protein n=2 Tax=Octopus TaxID=6643 RepID=A0AA36BA77_OCTVU|nr:UPF0669 protein C6orf120 homolog [Octopus sinensis]XP_029642452.1 UPF0669 protein C6orf120 homolog [Octopus sinensis]XP_029642453.1 UPF0669 protein C6orf120 homolog [Octopus sinensis]XP_029642455.1 UPF0669 protein C6orf120 homolog [Octopus sinensis]CAI9730404.1 Hypothetical predicted protein [Octopus vulgaris]